MRNSERKLTDIFKQTNVVQHYPTMLISKQPYDSLYRSHSSAYFFQQEIFEELERTAIVEDYIPQHSFANDDGKMDIQQDEGQMREEQPYQELFPNEKARYSLAALKMLDSDSSGRELPSRNSSVSSITSESSKSNSQSVLFKFKPTVLEIQQPNTKLKIKPQLLDLRKSGRGRREVGSSAEKRERLNKIKKLQEIGCNCKKSKCLKMYCECFNLQILCGPNCNCVGCGNCEQNQSHQKAVLDALTRNPKAFAEDIPVVESAFQLGVQLSEVRKGCKCRKTQCRKKYCQCFNSGLSCGKFCQCDGCENHNEH